MYLLNPPPPPPPPFPAVLGPVDPSEVGVVLPHEHLFINFSGAATVPAFGADSVADLSFSLENYGKILQFP